MNFAVYNTPLGNIRVEYSFDAITGINFVGDDLTDNGATSSLTDAFYLQLVEYLEGDRQQFDLPLSVFGTKFQRSVWCAISAIPYGETRTYGEIAMFINRPRAARAVGAACNRNPLLLVVPCHRVVGASGSLVGYAGGINIKKLLLELER